MSAAGSLTGLLSSRADSAEEDEQGDLPRDDKSRQMKLAAGACGGCSLCCCLLVAIILAWRAITLGPLFKDGGELDSYRPQAALEAEQLRREAAERDGSKLLTYKDLPNVRMVGANAGAAAYFKYFNFVQGFLKPGFWNAFFWIFKSKDKFRPPVKDETVGVMSYQEFAKTKWNREFEAPYFKDFYTGGRVPSWEDNDGHKAGVRRLDLAVSGSQAVGVDPIMTLRDMEPRFAFDNKALTKAAWDGFRYMGPMDLRYASNGAYGIAVIEHLMEKYNTTGDVLGLLMTDSVFSAHLRRNQVSNQYDVDLTSMEAYTPIPGYARLGGRASFVEDGGRLRTVKLTYGAISYTDFDVPDVETNYVGSKRTGWRFAEASIIASLLSMTNLVMHVKDLHLELAAAFQAVTVDAFAGEPRHPVRRLLDPFISRSIQATNDNFKLLFNYHAADFSLAPLGHEEQLRLIGDAVNTRPLILADMDMENFGKVRNIEEDVSTLAAVTNSSRWGWRWHYRALTVQRLYDELVRCWLEAHFKDTEGGAAAAVENDGVLQAWWKSMIDHIPSLKRATQLRQDWADPGKLTVDSLAHVARVLMVWLSWIHEDVGHAAAAYVYNPVYTPMCVPEDGIGVPAASWSFNAVAYRGFVFLHRATLLEEPPDFWFDGNDGCGQCFAIFQNKLRALGKEDVAFSECEKTGFYSCVDRVETAVSS